VHDVAIVGAGLAGMAAARALEARGLGVLVIESHHEVGGRVRSHELGGGVSDLGGEWVGPNHQHMIALVRALGLTLEPTGFLGAPIMWRGESGDRVSRLPGRDLVLPLVRTQLELGRLAEGVSPETPWTAEHAAELDSRTYADWLRSRGVRGAAYTHLTELVGALSSCRAEEISLLQIVWWSARAGSAFSTLRKTVQWRIAEGAQTICRRIASDLRGELLLGTPVARIEQDGAVEIATEDGAAHTARRAVVTVPPGAEPAIDYEPGLPAGQRRGEEELHMEPAVKLTALLPPGHSAPQKMVLGGHPVGVAWRYDDRVTGFVAPWEADAGDDAILSDLAGGFGLSADRLIDPEIMRWSRRARIPGGDLGFRPGQLTGVAPLLGEDHGLVAMAGAERSSWPNNMEGAVASGVRAAARTAAALAAPAPARHG
jgi:monoamine oxidase